MCRVDPFASRALGLSVDDLARDASVKPVTIKAVESGQGWPLHGPLGRIADALGIDERELVEAVEAEQWGEGPREFSIYDTELDPESETTEWLSRADWREIRQVYRQARRDAERETRQARTARSRR